MLRVAVISACVVAALAAPAEYNRCKKGGPANWGGNCGAAEQSPIDLCGAKPLPDRGLSDIGAAQQVETDRLVFNKEYGSSHTLSFDTAGKAQIDFAGKGFSLDATDLPNVVGRGNDEESKCEGKKCFQWNLVQAHFHWGRAESEGSEHYLEGEQYPLEVHFVHINNKYADLTAAVGQKDGLLVVGQMYKVDSTESASMSSLGTALSNGGQVTVKATELLDIGQSTSTNKNTVENTYSHSGGFYTYAGSLTTPGCNAVVTWVVLAKPLSITKATMQKFWDIKSGGIKVSDHGNYRPLQALGERTLYHSIDDCQGFTKGDCVVKTYPCNPSGAREPVWDCKSNPLTPLEIAMAVLFPLAFLALIATCIWCRKADKEVVERVKVTENYVEKPVMMMTTPVMTAPMTSAAPMMIPTV